MSSAVFQEYAFQSDAFQTAVSASAPGSVIVVASSVALSGSATGAASAAGSTVATTSSLIDLGPESGTATASGSTVASGASLISGAASGDSILVGPGGTDGIYISGPSQSRQRKRHSVSAEVDGQRVFAIAKLIAGQATGGAEAGGHLIVCRSNLIPGRPQVDSEESLPPLDAVVSGVEQRTMVVLISGTARGERGKPRLDPIAMDNDLLLVA